MVWWTSAHLILSKQYLRREPNLWDFVHKNKNKKRKKPLQQNLEHWLQTFMDQFVYEKAENSTLIFSQKSQF